MMLAGRQLFIPRHYLLSQYVVQGYPQDILLDRSYLNDLLKIPWIGIDADLK